MCTVTWAVPVSTVAVSPTDRPLAVRNEVLTSTWPGASDQCPAITPYPSHDDPPPNAHAFTLPSSPGTLTPFWYTVVCCAVPGWARSAAVTAASWPASGHCPGPAAVPGPLAWISTGTVADRVCAAAAWPSEECSPNAKITAVAPNAIAARLTAVRAGRANGAARPRPTGRGRGSRAASRCAAYPRPAAGARPAASARGA